MRRCESARNLSADPYRFEELALGREIPRVCRRKPVVSSPGLGAVSMMDVPIRGIPRRATWSTMERRVQLPHPAPHRHEPTVGENPFGVLVVNETLEQYSFRLLFFPPVSLAFVAHFRTVCYVGGSASASPWSALAVRLVLPMRPSQMTVTTLNDFSWATMIAAVDAVRERARRIAAAL